MALTLLIAAVTVTVLAVQAYAMPPVMSPSTMEMMLGNSLDKTACGENLCRCSRDYADCSGHPNGLQYIPRLPRTIRYLNFSHNQLKGIFHRSMFQNVTNITKLYLNNNGITYINPLTFSNFTQLQELDMAYNDINLSSLSTILTVSTLTTLNLAHCGLWRLPDGVFKNATLPKLSTLLLYGNRIKHIRLSTFRPLPGLTLLDLSHNHISHLNVDNASDVGSLSDWVFKNATLPKLSTLLLYSNQFEHIRLSTFRPLPGLTQLDLSNNHISNLTVDHVSDLKYLNMNGNDLSDFPTTCSKTNSSLFTRLTQLNLTRNKISSVGGVCLPELKHLDLSHNTVLCKPPHAFSLGMFPSLTTLILEFTNLPITTLAAGAFSSPSLRKISLEFNQLEFRRESIDNKCFANCPLLSDLQLSFNHLDISEERFIRFFGHLAQMKYLYMGNCHISVLTPRMFSGFPRLEKLALDRNRLRGIPDETFDGLRKLKVLYLDKNQISAVPPTLFSADTRQRLTSLDLSGNPFTCSCDVLWFQSWYISHPSLFGPWLGSYDCFNVPGVNIGSFYLPSQACLLSRSAAVMVIVSVSLVLLVLALVVTVFRYRWHFRLLLHEAFRGNGETRRRRLETGRFQYDLFVSYDSDNLSWVLQHLVPQLEERRGLRLCLHHRDFTPGRHIVDNIAECVENSKKVLMLFSASFVQSQWCQFELTLCLRCVMDYDDALVIVCLDDVPSRDLTTAMIAVLKTTTYIQWVDDDNDAMTSFWGRLDVALQEILPRRDVRVPIEGRQGLAE